VERRLKKRELNYVDLSKLGEFGLIQRFRRSTRSQGPGLQLGIGDDAALTSLPSPQIVTCDLLLEGVHFQRRWHPLRLLGRKALSVNLSDIAAMGGIPRFALLGLGLPKNMSVTEADALRQGFLEVARENQVELIGGDTCASDRVVLAVTVLGQTGRHPCVRRSGARPGDAIFVTGTLGDAAWGLELLRRSRRAGVRHPAVRRLLDPAPRVKLGQKLAAFASAMIDLSDGLLTDLGHVLEESRGLAARIEVAALPLSKTFRRYFRIKGAPSGKALALAAAGGEDYELLFTAAPQAQAKLARLAAAFGIPITRIGGMVAAARPSLRLVGPGGELVPLPQARFEHFRKAR